MGLEKGGVMTLQKTCRCHPATASGPRLVYRDKVMLGDPVPFGVFIFALVPMACDVCDTAWKESSS